MDHTDVNFTGGPKDQHPTITGKKYFIFSPGKTFKAKEDIIRIILQQIPGVRVQTVEECDVILVFCVIVSRTGTDIDAALNELNAHSESKPAVFIVLHHTFDPEKIVPDSSRYVSRESTLTVDCLFHEDDGLLDCVKNRETLIRIQQLLQPQDTQDKKEISTSNESDLIIASELTLVLLGMSVFEKTAVEHMIFGTQESQCNASPAPLMKITVDTGVVDGGQVTVINTPDWFSSGLSTEEMKQKIQFCIRLSSHGPYALLLVIPVKQFIEEKTEIVNKFEMIFEESCREKVIILFTVKNEHQKQDIHDLQTKLRNQFHVLNISENQFHVLNISETGDRSQVSELLKKVEIIVKGNVQRSDACEMSETQIEKAIANSKQVSVEEVNYIKVSLQKLQRTVWIALKPSEPSEPFEMLSPEELEHCRKSSVV